MDYKYEDLEKVVAEKETTQKNEALLKKAKELGINLDEYKVDQPENKGAGEEVKKQTKDGEKDPKQEKSPSESKAEINEAVAKSIAEGIAKAMKEVTNKEETKEQPKVSL